MFRLGLCIVIHINLPFLHAINCKDQLECESKTLPNSEPIYCSGNWACYDAKIETTGAIECTGNRGCIQAKVIETSGDIECLGAWGCSAVNNGVSGNQINCGGRSSCYQSILTAATNVYCQAQWSCEETKIKAQLLYLYGKGSAYNADIIVDQVYVDGYYAAQQATIKTKNIQIRGFRSMDQAIITSRGELTLNCLDTYSTQSTTVNCKRNNQCNIVCESNCCAEITLYYFDSNQLSVSCNDQTGAACPQMRQKSMEEMLALTGVNNVEGMDEDEEVMEYLKKEQNMAMLKNQEHRNRNLNVKNVMVPTNSYTNGDWNVVWLVCGECVVAAGVILCKWNRKNDGNYKSIDMLDY